MRNPSDEAYTAAVKSCRAGTGYDDVVQAMVGLGVQPGRRESSLRHSVLARKASAIARCAGVRAGTVIPMRRPSAA